MQIEMQAELDKLVSALREFYAHESFLFEKDLGERALTHRLAVVIERHFPGWEVDCDYDRLGERTLRMPKASIVSTDDHLGKSVYPDIVVHRRAVPDNLLAVEGAQGQQSPAARTRPAQVVRIDRPVSLVCLPDRGRPDAGENGCHIGRVCRWGARRHPVRLVIPAAQERGFGWGKKRLSGNRLRLA